MIPLSLSLEVVCVLSIWTMVYAADCGDRQAEINGRCCDLCPPGEYMKEYCSEHQQTLCSPCEEGFYSDQYHIFDRCEECQSCQQDYADKCTPTTNANCSCRSGFLCSNSICSNCEENKCITGEKLKTATSSGVTSIQYSYECEPGQETHAERSIGDFMHVSLSIGFVLLSLTLLVLLSYACTKNLRKYKAYNNPIEVAAVSTHTSDFHLSKEESGLKIIVQDEAEKIDCCGQLQLEKVDAT